MRQSDCVAPTSRIDRDNSAFLTSGILVAKANRSSSFGASASSPTVKPGVADSIIPYSRTRALASTSTSTACTRAALLPPISRASLSTVRPALPPRSVFALCSVASASIATLQGLRMGGRPDPGELLHTRPGRAVYGRLAGFFRECPAPNFLGDVRQHRREQPQ